MVNGRSARIEARITAVRAHAYVIPTDRPEADGTLSWSSTALVVAEIDGGGATGLGYTYSDPSNAALINGKLAQVLAGADAMDSPSAHRAMRGAVRNMGGRGLAATAISALDLASWDLKAKLLDLPLATLLGRARDAVPIYGSGGFTTYSDDEMRAQLNGWVERDGCAAVKIKVGSEPSRDPHRVAVAKAAIGERTLFVDGNGAYGRKAALDAARLFAAEAEVGWFEEPVSSDDLAGLRLLRDRAPSCMEIAAGEYGYTPADGRAMLEAGAVDVLQADATRCGGVTGFLAMATLADAHGTDLSGHCGPAAHLHVACAAPRFRHLEWFHDHVRIEHMLFDGAPVPCDGSIRPDLSRPGLGLSFRRQDAERFAA